MEEDLTKDIMNSARVMGFTKGDVEFAKELYAALSNLIWTKNGYDWTATFRYNATLVASIRTNEVHQETYIDFYCSKREGVVTKRVENELKQLGWSWREYELD